MSKISSRISNMSANFKIGFTQYRQNSIYIMASANAELAILVDISRLDSHNTDRTLLGAANGHKSIKGESDGEPDRTVSGCIKQDGVDVTHGQRQQEIKLFPINNGNVSEYQVEDNDQQIPR
ncbi:uncharacterized protein LOC144487211 [Mustelus asterias]